MFWLLGVILRRCLGSLPLLLLLSIVSFAVIKAIPGDPVDILLGQAEKDVSPAQVQAMRNELGLNQPMAKQYLSWLKGVITKGEFGRSYRDERPALTVIQERLPATLLLVGSALVVSFTFGILWGLLMVFLRLGNVSSALDALLVSVAVIFYSAPSFWVGFIALAIVSKWEPSLGIPVLGLHEPGLVAGWETMLRHAFLPALVLASRRTAKVALFVRASTLEELNKGYVTTARSKGLSSLAVLTRHVIRNSLLPVVSLVGLSLPALLGGSVMVESVFAWPGMGRLAVDATFGRNYPILLALIMIYGTLVIVSNLVADVVQLYLDPRALDQELESQSHRLVGGHA